MRNFHDPAYKAWRKRVFTRDKYRCRYPGCIYKGKIECHHIFPWASWPDLRLVDNNGITLCKYHHKLVTGREEDFQEMFSKIVKPPSLDVMITMYKMRKK